MSANAGPDAEFPVVRSIPRFTGRVITVRTDELRMPDGSTSDRDIVAHPGAVAVLALDEADRVVLVRQWRQPVSRLLEELPAGLLDVAGEPALAAAERELREEAALTATEWHVLIDLYTSPGMSDEAIRVFLARGLRDVADNERFEREHEEATMTSRRLPIEAAVAAVFAAEITNAVAVAGILAATSARVGHWTDLRPADAPWPARPGI